MIPEEYVDFRPPKHEYCENVKIENFILCDPGFIRKELSRKRVSSASFCRNQRQKTYLLDDQVDLSHALVHGTDSYLASYSPMNMLNP